MGDEPDESSRDIADHANQLNMYDAYRFRAVVEEVVERLDLLGLTTVENKTRKDDPGDGGGNRKDVYHLMINQKELEEKYEMLMIRRSQLRGLANKQKYMENQAQLDEVAAALRESTSTIVNNLQDRPTVVSNIQKIQNDRADVHGLLETTIEDLRVDHFNSLVDQVNLRLEQQRLLWETQLAHEKTREALKNLEGELRNERDNYGKSTDEKNAEIYELTAQLKHQKKVTALRLKYEKETALARQETVKRLNTRHLNEIRSSINQKNDGLERDTAVHDASIQFLTAEQEELHKMHDMWEAKLEADYGKLEKEFDDLQENCDDDNEELVKFRGWWKLNKAERLAREEEKKQRAIEEENKKKLLRIMNLAQQKIHFFWRVYARKGGGKKKGKKGGKKKGSKKKKK